MIMLHGKMKGFYKYNLGPKSDDFELTKREIIQGGA